MKQPKEENRNKGKDKDKDKKKDKKKETKVKFNFISRKSVKRSCNPAAVTYVADQEVCPQSVGRTASIRWVTK